MLFIYLFIIIKPDHCLIKAARQGSETRQRDKAARQGSKTKQRDKAARQMVIDHNNNDSNNNNTSNARKHVRFD
ncbi:hypothetical protein EMCRGX_G016210 [Ephydatia muelleri]